MADILFIALGLIFCLIVVLFVPAVILIAALTGQWWLVVLLLLVFGLNLKIKVKGKKEIDKAKEEAKDE